VAAEVTDDDGGSDLSIYEYVMVYDPNAGSVTGNGRIHSPPGAYVADPTLVGKASFKLDARYKKGASAPTGNSKFYFQAGDLDLRAEGYEALTVAGYKATFSGTGRINGAGNFGFQFSVIDAALTPSSNVDRFRIKIWDRDNGDVVVYDNQVGCSSDLSDDAEPCAAIDSGNIYIRLE
jgi:hypothetical protein